MILFVERAVKDFLNNRFLNIVTIITIALSILIVSAFSLFYINANDLMNSWKNGIRIIAYLKQTTSRTDVSVLREQISGMEGVEKVNFIPREEAFESLKSQMKRQSSLLENLDENPLPDAFEIRIFPTILNWEKIELLAKQVEGMPQVDGVEYGQKWLGRFNAIFQLFRFTGMAMGIIFFMAAVFIVANTVRLMFYSRRDEFEIMRLVGATDTFIKTPFYITSIIQGALGGIVGILILFLAYSVISGNMGESLSGGYFTLRFLPFKFVAVIFFGGTFAGWMGCYLSLKQFVKN